MSVLKRIVFFLGTLIIIVTGFFMPDLASRGLDYQLRNSVEQTENKKISLVLSDSEEDIKNAWTFFNLTILDPNASIVEISEKSKTCNFTYDKIKTISSAILEQLGISDYNYNDFKAVPNLFISLSDEVVAKSAVYWCCSWTDKNNIPQIMWIDDINGKMVGLILNFNEINDEMNSSDGVKQSINNSESDIPKAVTALVEYCKENYQADDVRCRNELDRHYAIEIIYKEPDKDNNNLIYPISVYFEDNKYLFFNV